MDYLFLLIGILVGGIITFLYFLVQKNKVSPKENAQLQELEGVKSQLTTENQELSKGKAVLEERLKNAERIFTENKERIVEQERTNRIQAQKLAETETNLKNRNEKLQ
ncbi:MAG: hypothetical protein ACPGVD_11355, partial [Flavobacteriales bacterium]